MNSTGHALGVGLHRGWIEFRHTMTNAGELLGWLWLPLVGLIVMYVLSGNTIPGTTVSLGSAAVPGILGMNVVITGMMGLASALTVERENGTLLRAKATPNGTLGYLTGKVTSQAGMAIATVVIILIPAAFLFSDLRLGEVSAWPSLVAVLALGLVATLPIGAVLGTLFKSVQSLGFIMMLIMGVVAVSGVFYPVTAFPAWLQWVAQVFPLYWLGLGLRWAMLPDAMSAVEIGQSWRHLEMIGVLGGWTILGFVLAPIVLRRMARRQSGVTIARRDESVA